VSNAPGRPPKLTVEQVATIERVWLDTANASEAARAAGCHEASARRYIIRCALPKADDLYAQVLARAERDHLALVGAGRKRLRLALDVADDAAVVDITRAANDSLRAVTATKMAHAKLTGKLIDRTDVTSGGKPLALYLPDET
jgi:hypothetical protein